MNYEGQSVFDLSGGGGNDPQVQINTDDIAANAAALDVVKQVGYIGAFAVDMILPSTAITLLSDNRSHFYATGYAPIPAEMQLELFSGSQMIVKRTDQQRPYGFRWVKPDGVTTAAFELSVRAAFYSRTDTNINVGLRVDRKDIHGASVIPKEFQIRLYPASASNVVYTYTVDLTHEFALPDNVAYIDFSLWGGTGGANIYEVTYIVGSTTTNQISVKRVR